MSLTYHVYTNDHAGGAVDYGTIIATTASLTYNPIAISPGSDCTFAVRTFDTVTGLEDLNSDARVQIVTDASGNDITNRPLPPGGLSARATKGGKILIEWSYLLPANSSAPTGFKAWTTAGASVNYAGTPILANYFASVVSYSVETAALTDATTYAIGVRATNASGDETNVISVSVIADATGPTAVINLTGSPTY